MKCIRLWEDFVENLEFGQLKLILTFNSNLLHGHCCITQFPKLLAVSPVVFVMPSFCMSLLEC